MNKSDRIVGASLGPESICKIVAGYGIDMKLVIRPHDLRRTFAKLARKGGAALEQIQLSLGHASIRTTEKYLGIRQDLADAPCDRLGLRLNYREKREQTDGAISSNDSGDSLTGQTRVAGEEARRRAKTAK